MNNKQQFLYVGMDIHKDTHGAVAANCFGQQLLKLEISNSRENFQKLVDNVGQLGRQEGLTPVFGLEDSYGYGALLEKHLF